MQQKASECDNCLCWLETCQAECCKVFLAHKNQYRKNHENYVIDTRIFDNTDLQKYYKWRGCKVIMGRIIAPIKKFKLVQKGDFVEFWNQCEKLTEDNLCSVHGTDDKPELCRRFDPCDKRTFKGVYVTPRCLARYKESGTDEKQE